MAEKNTIVRGCLVPSLKNKPLDGRQDVPTLVDIANIENPYVNFIFPVAETGKWYKVVSLKTKVIDELVIPDGEIDKYELFGEGLTEEEKAQFLTKTLAEQTYLNKNEAQKNYLKKVDAEANYLSKEEASEIYQLKGDDNITYDEIGDVDLDNVIDEQGVEYVELGEVPEIDFDSLS